MAHFRLAKKCIAFFATICILPVILVLLVTTDQYMRPQQQRHLLEYETNSGRYSADNYINFTAIDHRMQERRQHLTKQCSLLGLDVTGNDSLHRPNPWEFLVNRKHHLVWCNVFKAASTSWMYNFNLLAGYSPHFLKNSNLVPLTLARKKYPRPTLTELEEAIEDGSVTFLIVRHPFERLLSAYRDKLLLPLPLSHHQKLGAQIIAKYRRKQQKNGNNGSILKTRNRSRAPTFDEFVRYLFDSHNSGKAMDMHWTPITEFCTPCMVHFNVIAKFETLWEDQKYLIHLANLDEVIKPEWRNAMPGKDTADLIPQYFKQLTKAQMYQLHNIYRYDFELFNYTLKGYIEYGKDEET